MRSGNVELSEGFGRVMARVLVTAKDTGWARRAAEAACGFGTSLIMCPAECGIDGEVDGTYTPDGRPGIVFMVVQRTLPLLEEQLVSRISQCVLTTPTAACFNAQESDEVLPVGSKVQYFGDKLSTKEERFDRTLWRIPLMGGDFLIEDTFGVVHGESYKLWVMGSEVGALTAARAAAETASKVEGVFLPFPGGISAAGSKVGSVHYSFLKASTNHPYCPTVRDRIESRLPEGIEAVYELVITGLDRQRVEDAMYGAVEAAAANGAARISAGTFAKKVIARRPDLADLLK